MSSFIPRGRRPRRFWLLAAIAALPMVLSGCASVGGPSDAAASTERPFLLSPTDGWSGSLAPDRALWLEDLHQDLLMRDDRLRVLNETLGLLEREPDFHPARVLEAQVRFLSGRYATVVDRMAPLRLAAPGYVAAEVLHGRASEHLDRPVEAFESYWGVRSRSAVAAERATALREVALDTLADRFETQVADGLRAEASHSLALLERYAPGEPRTVAAADLLAESTADPLARLTLLRQQSAEPGADPELIRRRAELELEVGDAATAVRLAEGLAQQRPGDRGIAELLQRARFRWRLNVLPADVGGLARQSELSRADYAVLLYWLFPGVRYGRPSEARIASDIIDHPQREQIVRVINLGLLEVDPTVHRFEPEAPLRHGQALGALLELLAASTGSVACLEEQSGVPRSSAGLCEAARGCYLLLTDGECDPRAAVSGPQALEMIRRTLATLGAAA